MENTNVTEQSTNEIMPMAASGETNFASLTEKTTPASGDMFLMEDSEDTKKINYDKLADAILNKLTSKTYSGLETTAKNFVAAINELNSKSQSASYSAGNVIPSNSNLNDYTQPGVYRIESSSEASTIKNLPDGVDTGCRLEVSVAGTGWIRQCLYPNNNTKIYIRTTANNYAFTSPWYVLTPSELS